jgi:hypothetical protein
MALFCVPTWATMWGGGFGPLLLIRKVQLPFIACMIAHPLSFGLFLFLTLCDGMLNSPL